MLAHLLGDGSFVEAPADPLRQHRRGQPLGRRRGRPAPLRHHRDPRRLRRRARDHPAAASAVPPHPRQAQPDRCLARRGRPVRPAQPREVRSRLGLRPPQGAGRPLPPPPLGHRRLRPLGRKSRHGPHLLRLDEPPARRRLSPGSCSASTSSSAVQTSARRRATATATTCYIYGAENQLRFLRRASASTVRGRPRRMSWLSGCALCDVEQHQPRHHPRRRSGIACAQVLHDRKASRTASSPRRWAPTVLRFDDVEARAEPTSASHASPTILDDADLEVARHQRRLLGLASLSIEPLGEQEVYDATVLGTHNFVANGICRFTIA